MEQWNGGTLARPSATQIQIGAAAGAKFEIH
jgi:hypothetical protein